MVNIVAAGAAVHAPQLLSRPPHEELTKLDHSTDALKAFGAALTDARPDAVIVIGLDHLETFWLEAVPTFTMVISPECEAHYMSLHRTKTVHTDLAVQALKGVVSQGFDLTYSQSATLGHAFLTPFEYILGESDIPVIPLLVNTYLPPIPTPRRCHELGRAIRKALESRNERIAVIASGGMSHFPGTSRYTSPNYAFDEWVIQETAAGRYERLLDLTPVNLDEVGESELLTWFVMLGLIGDIPGSLLSYEALSHHGQGVLQFLPPLGETPQPPKAEVPLFGGHVFQSEDFIYYKFPEPDSLPLNRFLHEIIVDEAIRSAMIDDKSKALAASGLEERFRQAFRGDGFDELVAAGAHPLLALSARQVLRLHAEAANKK